MKCGSIYVKLVPIDKNLKFLKYCYLIKILPVSFQNEIEDIIHYINDKYFNEMIVPMVVGVHPGCIVKPEFTEIIATEIYNKYVEMMKKHSNFPSVRCMCIVGEVDNPHKSDNIHTSNGISLIQLGRTLDSTDESGLFIL